MYFKKFLDLKAQGKIEYVVLDGLDGSGKGTLAHSISELLKKRGFKVLVRDYPEYTTFWGKIIKKELRNPNSQLTIEERMALFAINRLETLEDLISTTVEDDNNLIIFDRFFTSNILTIAYYLSQNELALCDLSEIEERLKGLNLNNTFQTIINLDQGFIDLLDCKDNIVCIPQINPRISMERLQKDESRDDTDFYEDIRVQMIADYLYQIAAESDLFNVRILKQEGRTPNEISAEIIELYELNNDETEREGSINVMKEPASSTSVEITDLINIILQKYPNLQQFLDY